VRDGGAKSGKRAFEETQFETPIPDGDLVFEVKTTISSAFVTRPFSSSFSLFRFVSKAPPEKREKRQKRSIHSRILSIFRRYTSVRRKKQTRKETPFLSLLLF